MLIPKQIPKSLPTTFAALGALYVALSPRVALPFYNTRLFHPDKYPIGDYGICSIDGVKRRDVYLKSNNGSVLHGWYFKVPGAAKTLLYNHGNAGNLTHRVPALQLLFAAGVSVFIYDYQGFGKSGGIPTVQAICNDGISAFDYLVKHERIDPQNILIYGESLGSGVACHVSAAREHAGLIIQSGFSSLQMIAREVLPFTGIYPSWLFPRPELDNVSVLRKDHPPLLILHGKRDIVVPFAHAEEIYKHATEPKLFVPLPKAGHSDITVVEPLTYTNAITDFISSLCWHRPWCYLSRPLPYLAEQPGSVLGA